MSVNRSRIGWTDYSGGDANFVSGCTPVSAGCANCYARAIYQRFGRDHSQVSVDYDKLIRLASWQPQGPWKRGSRPMVFVCDTGDLFHDEVPSYVLRDVLSMLAARADIDWQVLTKRAQRMVDEVVDWLTVTGRQAVPANLWLGVTAENQAMADERIPLLLRVPAAVRWVSVEPMLEPVDLAGWLYTRRCTACGQWWDDNPVYCTNCGGHGQTETLPTLHWVVCGAESGPNRREFQPWWAQHLWMQCLAAGLPFFGKQSSAQWPGQPLLIEGKVRQEWPQSQEVATCPK